MTREEFDQLVERLEVEAKANPRSYKLKVFFLALLGYGYIALVFLSLLVAVALVILLSSAVRSIAFAGKLIVPLVVLMFYILRSLWVRFPGPQGIALTRTQAKPLFDLAGQLKRELKAPRMHSILLTDDFNAAVAQVPRLGLFGWHKNYLVVGMPLMQALSPEQFTGVLAHEFGHLSGKHGHFSAWVYRIRRTWAQLMDALERRRHWGAAVFSGFLKWYVPLFDAYTFVLARAQEYEADREAASLVGSRQFADALIAINVIGAFLDSTFWPALYKRANDQPEPPPSPFLEMGKAFRSDIRSDQESEWLSQAMDLTTRSEDTHPSLSERLKALGETATPPARVIETAAQRFLGASDEALCVNLAELWRSNISDSWHERHRFASEARRQLDLLDQKAQSQSLTLEEEWDRATLTEEFRDPQAALPLYRRVLSLNHEHAGASFAVGRLTLQQNDSLAVGLIEQAMKLNHQYVIPGCELIHNHLLAEGKTDEAERYRNWALNQSAAYQAASEERSTVNSNDSYIAHNLDQEQVDQLCRQLDGYSEVRAAYLVSKKVGYFPEMPLYVLGIEPASSWYKSISTKEAAELSSKLAGELSLPGDFFVVVFTNNSKNFRKTLQEVPNSLIRQRGK